MSLCDLAYLMVEGAPKRKSGPIGKHFFTQCLFFLSIVACRYRGRFLIDRRTVGELSEQQKVQTYKHFAIPIQDDVPVLQEDAVLVANVHKPQLYDLTAAFSEQNVCDYGDIPFHWHP